MLADPTLLATLYFTAAFVFGLVYWVVWHHNSDAFIVHEEMNLHPLAMWPRRERVRQKNRSNDRTPSSVEPLTQIYDECVGLTRRVEALSTSLADLEPRLEEARRTATSVGEAHSKEMASKMSNYMALQRKTAIDGVTEALRRHKQQLELNPNDLVRAEHEYTDEMRKALHVSEVALADFTTTSIVDDFVKAFADRDKLEDDYLNLSREKLEVLSQLRERLSSWQAQRARRLNFFDFLYFSMGVATSNTFGDLIPNHRTVRLIIVLQLIVSILLVGLLINALATP